MVNDRKPRGRRALRDDQYQGTAADRRNNITHLYTRT